MPSQVLLPQTSNASHLGLLQTVLKPGKYASYTISLVSLPAGAFFCSFEHATPTLEATYATVQTSYELHMDLNSDLVYANHSCKPSLEFDVTKMEVRVSREKALEVGEKLTFFYPSTEWDMVQPFDCNCGEQECLGRISGANHIETAILNDYWLNEHIQELVVLASTG